MGTSLFGLSMYYNWVEGTILNIPMILLATGLVGYFVTIALFNWVGGRS
ncbi:hypothetical protein [Geomicrobium sp. JCM 19038]|nr:hypothetical protein [Geomicrobium sp. JCM 19038]